MPNMLSMNPKVNMFFDHSDEHMKRVLTSCFGCSVFR
jgi:hypothetical protein